MFSHYRQITTILIVLGLVATGLAFVTSSNNNSNPVNRPEFPPPASYQVPVFIKNNLSTPIVGPFEEMIVINSTQYSQWENSNLSNVFFESGNHTNVIPSWLESGNSSSDNNTTYWLRINSTLPSQTTLVVDLAFGTLGVNFFNNYATGEAPQLSTVYGQYDDGSHVFNFYDNFSGTVLKGSLWSSTGSFAISNGITFTTGSSILTSKGVFGSPGFVEAYGVMNTPQSTNQTSYFLGGAGFGNGGMNLVAPVMTTGWAENDTNGLGLSIWNGNGNAYTYNFSRNLNVSRYHLFGTGYLNSTHTVGAVDNVIENSSSVGIGTTSPLNVTIGFQSSNFPQTNHFYWIFERNATSNGQNLPFQVGGQTVTITESGLPSGTFWTSNILNVINLFPNGGLIPINSTSAVLPNGEFNFTLSSSNNLYVPENRTSNFTVSGSPVTVKVRFVLNTYEILFTESGLPTGSSWTANFSNTTYASQSSTINLTMANGTHSVQFSTTSGYIPYPGTLSFTVSGHPAEQEVIFQSPSNASYIHASSTILPSQGVVYPDYWNPSYATTSLYSVSLDPANNRLFYIGFNFPVNTYLGVMNLSSGSSKQENLSQLPIAVYYDPSSGLLYVGFENGSAAAFYPDNLTTAFRMSFPNLSGTPFTIIPSTDSSMLYAFGYNNSNQSQGFLYSFLPDGTEVGNVTFHNLTSKDIFYFFSANYVGLAPPVTGNRLVITNNTGILAVNATTGSETYVPTPVGFIPYVAAQYGEGSNFIIGNQGGNGSVIFNLSGMSVRTGPAIKGTVTAAVFDPQNGLEYVSSFPGKGNATLPVGNISAVYANNGTIAATAPSMNQSSLVLDAQGQTLLSPDLIGTTGVVHAYSLIRGYKATFSETGLQSGTTWYVNITGEPSSGPIAAGSSYSTVLFNGTYSFGAGTSFKTEHFPGGKYTVSGSNVTESVAFTPVLFGVTFQEKGLPVGTKWVVVINGQEYNSTSSRLVVNLTNGTYSYTVKGVSGYSVANQSGTFNVTGSQPQEQVVFSRQNGQPGSPVPLIVLAAGGSAVVAAILVLYYWKRRKP